jgi:hypothetical protein
VTSGPWKANVMESALPVDAILHSYAYDKAWPQMRATRPVARKRDAGEIG